MTDEPRPETEGQAPGATATEAASPEHGHAGHEHAEHHEHGHPEHVHGPDCDHDHDELEEGEEPAKKLTQEVNIQDIGPCKKHIKVTIDRADIQGLLNEKYSELVVDANVSGFRPGKAPRKIIERRYRKEVTEQVKGQLLYASLEQLADDHDLAPLSPPELDPNKIILPEQGPMVYEFDVEVRPEFDLPNYRGLKLKRELRDFTEKDVDEELHRILAPYGQLVPKEEGGVEVGDYLVCDLMFKDGAITLNESKETTIRVEPRLLFKDGYIENFGAQLQGAKAGETREVAVQLSSAVASPSLAGRTVTAAFEIKDVKRLRLPELSHEFLHTFEVHSVEQLRERIRVLLGRRFEYQQRRAIRDQVLNQIAVDSSWELPQDLLARQARRALSRRVMEMKSEGISENEIASRSRMLQQDAIQTTRSALKEHFVLQKIAELEKIEVNEDDINDEIDRMAAMNDESPRRVRAKLEKDDLMESLAAEMIERKALDLILAAAEYEEVKATADGVESQVTSVEQQAVPGEMRDLGAEATAAEAQVETPAQS